MSSGIEDNQFLAILAHELRSPLAPIRAALEILARPESTPETTKRAYAIMNRQVSQLTRLVEDLFDITRAARGRIGLQYEPVNLVPVAATAIEIAQPLIEARDHRLTTSLPQGEAIVLGDACRLTQVLANLLTNAAKYTTPGGEIWLTMKCDGMWTEVRVRDSGIGIAPHMLEHVFDMFVQAEPCAKDASSGMGIGLALARRLVELHSGRIEARSDGPGRGSEFIVHLPQPNSMRLRAQA